MVRAVVFDLWNTLVHSQGGDPFLHLLELMTPEQARLYPAFKRDAMVQAHADARTLLERWRPRMGLDSRQFDAMVGVFEAALADAVCFPETLPALEAAREVARLGLLSNTQGFDLELLERLGVNARIPNRFLSAETGFLKPEPGAFATVQKRMGLFPGELAMVGDSWHDDVEGALAAGWTAIWINRRGLPRPAHDPDAPLVELPDLARVAEVVEALQAGARCSTCLG